jgi:23S rRNA (guanosine2251-2'-O)-methyltransferase
MNLICGINPVVEALHAGSRHFDRLLVVKGLRNRRVSEAIAQAGRLGIPLRFESRETLDRMAGGLPHQGLIAVVSAKPVVTMEAVLDEARTPALVLLLDGVEDPRNLGAILRTADAAGVDGVLLPERHSAGLSETVSRASAGGIEHVKVARIGNVAQAIDALKERGVWVVGLDASGTERWDAVDYKRPIALVLGGEGRGIRRLVRERCDHLVSLPLFGHVGSLNVSVAAGVALYEVIRQRGSVPSHVRPIPTRPAAPGRVVGPHHDDGEHDPGDTAAARAAYAPEDGDEGDAAPVALALDDPDRPAWHTGPTVLAAVRGRGAHGGPPRPPLRHGKRRGPDGRRRDGGRREGAGREGPPRERHQHAGEQEGTAPPAALPAREGRPGKRRRGRNRRRHDGGGQPGPRPENAAGDRGMAPEEAERMGDAMPEGPKNGAPDGDAGPGPRPGGRGRRRRRRRR